MERANVGMVDWVPCTVTVYCCMYRVLFTPYYNLGLGSGLGLGQGHG